MYSVINKKTKLFEFKVGFPDYQVCKNQELVKVLPDDSLGELVADGTINDDGSAVLVRVFNNVKLVEGAFIKL